MSRKKIMFFFHVINTLLAKLGFVKMAGYWPRSFFHVYGP